MFSYVTQMFFPLYWWHHFKNPNSHLCTFYGVNTGSEVSFHLAERWKSGGSNIWSRRLRSEVRDILFPSCLLDAESPWIMEWVTWLSYLVCWEVNSWVGRIIHHLSGRGCLSKDMGLGTNSSHLAGAERLKCGLWSGRQPAAYLLEAERLRCGVEDNQLPCL